VWVVDYAGWGHPAFTRSCQHSEASFQRPVCYAGDVEAGSPGSRSAPREAAERMTNPGGVEASAALAPLPGCGFHQNGGEDIASPFKVHDRDGDVLVAPSSSCRQGALTRRMH
jgi:hypothetical protein